MATQIINGRDLQKWLQENQGQAVGLYNDKGLQKYQKADYGFLGNIADAFISPFANVARAGIEGLNYATAPKGTYQNIALTGDEQDNFGRFLINNAAGIAANFIPFGAGTLAGTIGRGGLSGLLATVGQSDVAKPLDIGDVAKGTLFGAGTAGVLGKLGGSKLPLFKTATSEADNVAAAATPKLFTNLEQSATQQGQRTGIGGFFQKAGEKITKAADNQEIGAFQRNIGIKMPNQKLATEFKRLGLFNAKDADELATAATEIISGGGERIKGALQQLDDQGIKVGQELLDPLRKSIKDPNIIPEIKVNIQKVLDNADTFIKQNQGELTPTQLYNFKQQIGRLKADFNAMSGQGTLGSEYSNLYFKINDKLDEVLKQNGFDDFLPVNKDVSAAFDALEYANKAGSKVMAGRPLNLFDVVTSAGGLAAGGPLGFGGAAVASKVLQSPQAESAVVKGMRNVGDFLKGGSNIKLPNMNIVPKPVRAITSTVAANPAVRQAAPSVVSRMFAGSPQVEAPAQELVNPDEIMVSSESGIPSTPQELYSAIIGLGFKPSDAESVMASLGMSLKDNAKAPSAETLKLQSNVQTGLSALSQIQDIVSKDSGVLWQGGLPNVIQSGNSQQYQAAVNQLSDIIGRLRSGGAINADEEARFKQYVPVFGDSQDTINKKIAYLAEQLQYISGEGQ